MHHFKGSGESRVHEPQKGVSNSAAWGQARAAGRQGPHPGVPWATHTVQGAPRAFPQTAKKKLQFNICSMKEIYSIMSNEECPLNCHSPPPILTQEQAVLPPSAKPMSVGRNWAGALALLLDFLQTLCLLLLLLGPIRSLPSIPCYLRKQSPHQECRSKCAHVQCSSAPNPPQNILPSNISLKLPPHLSFPLLGQEDTH